MFSLTERLNGSSEKHIVEQLWLRFVLFVFTSAQKKPQNGAKDVIKRLNLSATISRAQGSEKKSSRPNHGTPLPERVFHVKESVKRNNTLSATCIRIINQNMHFSL